MKLMFSFWLLTLASLVSSQAIGTGDPNEYFTWPPLPGPKWSLDPTVYASNVNITYGIAQKEPFRWQSNSSVVIGMYQEGDAATAKVNILSTCTNANYFYWNGDLGPIDLRNGRVAFLGGSNCFIANETTQYTNKSVNFVSHYFNLTDPPATTSTTPSSSGTATGLSTSMTSQNTAANSEQPVSNGRSNATILGAGLGGGIGGAVVIVAAAALYLAYRHKQKTKGQASQRGGHNASVQYGYINTNQHDYYSYDKRYAVPSSRQELPARSLGTETPRHEIP